VTLPHVNTSGPAFPSHGGIAEQGMTLRDWFAGQALAGLAEESYEAADAMLAAREAKA